MVKIMISNKRGGSLRATRNKEVKQKFKIKKGAPITEHNAVERLLDENYIAMAVWECLKNNDPEGVVEVIEAHLEVANKVKVAHEAGLSRATMYHAFKGKNPTLRTVAKLVNCCM